MQLIAIFGFLEKYSGALIERFAERGLILRTGALDLHETKKLHESFQEFVRKHKDAIGNILDFAVIPDDLTRRREVTRLA